MYHEIYRALLYVTIESAFRTIGNRSFVRVDSELLEPRKVEQFRQRSFKFYYSYVKLPYDVTDDLSECIFLRACLEGVAFVTLLHYCLVGVNP